MALLHEELKSPIRTRRLRGLVIARTIDCVESMEGAIVEMLADEDHLVRMEAATALAEAVTPGGVAALKQALADSSEVVREAAQRSLAELLRNRPAGAKGDGPIHIQRAEAEPVLPPAALWANIATIPPSQVEDGV